jgi:hypothetical protein
MLMASSKATERRAMRTEGTTLVVAWFKWQPRGAGARFANGRGISPSDRTAWLSKILGKLILRLARGSIKVVQKTD